MLALSYSTSNWKSAARIGICLLSSRRESLTYVFSLQTLNWLDLRVAMSSRLFLGEAAFLELLVELESVSLSIRYKTSCLVIMAYLCDVPLAARSPLSFANDFSS